MGASYFAGIGNVLAIRANKWSLARVQLPAILFFSLTMLIATLLHIPIFNWSHPIAWAWLAVYVVSPIAAVIVWIQMERGYQAPKFETNKLPAVFPTVMLIFALLDGIIGLTLFLFPEQIASFWPWSLTPLTSRVIGGWWLSGASLQFMLSQQKTLHTARIGLLANILVIASLIIGALIHFTEFDGPQISVWMYLLVNLLVGGFSVYSWVKAK
jgi:hypothetical protein